MRKYLFILITLLLPGPIQLLHAQSPLHSYKVKDGRMYIALGKDIPGPSLDSFIQRYDLSNLQLPVFIQTGKPDSLLHNGWKIEINNPEVLIISKPLAVPDKTNNPADKIVFMGQGNGQLPQPGNQVHFGYNRFTRKNAFAVKDSVVTFYLRGNQDAQKVMLAGTFNKWNPAALAMTRTDSGWIAMVNLGPGKHFYKFIIDGEWQTDRDNKLAEDDGMGNINSVYYKTNISFMLDGYTSARKVYLAGSFNNWAMRELLMQRTGSGWALPIYLSEGTHTYRFIADGKWLEDPANPDKLPNEYNEFNSVLRIGKPQLFFLKGYTGAQQVFLAGSFNSWNDHELLMRKTDSGWILPYTLGDGNYLYHYQADGKPLGDERTGGNLLLVIHPNYTFKLAGYPDAQRVCLAGDLNNWDSTGFRMIRTDTGWVLPVHLNKGKYRYKFLVDGKWILDPANPLWEENDYGTGNSVIWKEED